MRYILQILTLLCLSAPLMAQKARRVSAEYTYVSDKKDETPEQARREALLMARYEAIRSCFGELVAGQTDIVMNNNGGRTSMTFRHHGGTELKADWIETIKEEVRQQYYENGYWVVKVYVEGRAKEIDAAGVDFEYHILRNGTELRNEELRFKDRDRFYLTFRAPADGYLVVYVADEHSAYCVLPYAEQKGGNYQVKANRDYLFFSEDFRQEGEDSYNVAMRMVNLEKETVVNDVYVIFSPKPFTKKADRKGTKVGRNLELARNVDIETFSKWLAKCRRGDGQMHVERATITIAP